MTVCAGGVVVDVVLGNDDVAVVVSVVVDEGVVVGTVEVTARTLVVGIIVVVVAVCAVVEVAVCAVVVVPVVTRVEEFFRDTIAVPKKQGMKCLVQLPPGATLEVALNKKEPEGPVPKMNQLSKFVLNAQPTKSETSVNNSH